MSFQNLRHEAVDATAHGSKKHELIATVAMGRKRTFDSIELSAQLANTLDHFDGFAFVMLRSFGIYWHYTHPRYSIYPEGVSDLSLFVSSPTPHS